MINLKLSNYWDRCGYSGDNPNTIQVDLGELTLWFSYSTVVAYSNGKESAVSENCWGQTTGRHLNGIDGGDKRSRLPRGEFEHRLRVALSAYGLKVD